MCRKIRNFSGSQLGEARSFSESKNATREQAKSEKNWEQGRHGKLWACGVSWADQRLMEL